MLFWVPVALRLVTVTRGGAFPADGRASHTSRVAVLSSVFVADSECGTPLAKSQNAAALIRIATNAAKSLSVNRHMLFHRMGSRYALCDTWHQLAETESLIAQLVERPTIWSPILNGEQSLWAMACTIDGEIEAEDATRGHVDGQRDPRTPNLPARSGSTSHVVPGVFGVFGFPLVGLVQHISQGLQS